MKTKRTESEPGFNCECLNPDENYEPPKGDKEQHRAWIIRRCEERIACARIEANRAHKEGDAEGAALCRHSIGENQRAINKLNATP